MRTRQDQQEANRCLEELRCTVARMANQNDLSQLVTVEPPEGEQRVDVLLFCRVAQARFVVAAAELGTQFWVWEIDTDTRQACVYALPTMRYVREQHQSLIDYSFRVVPSPWAA